MKWTKPGTRTILLVEPDEQTVASINDALALGLRVVVAQTPEDAIARLATFEPNLVLLPFVLPGLGGIGLCRYIRMHSDTSVIFVSGVDPDGEALPSYAAGADGYIRKPYRMRELEARIQAALRHSAGEGPESTAITVGDVTLDLERHVVQVRGRVVALPLREFQVLSVLLNSPGKVWSRQALMRRVWTEMPASGTKSLDVHVRRIRARIEEDPSAPSRVLTVRGVGYRYALTPDYQVSPS